MSEPKRLSDLIIDARLIHRCGFALLFLSAVLWLGTTICFIGVWDHVAAVTVFPQWSWALLGIFGAMLAGWLLKARSHLPMILLLLWLLTTLWFADNLLPVIRRWTHGPLPSHPPTGMLRVVTLNCASSPLAAAEVMQFHPDIVLLQESPTSNKVAQLALEWFGDTNSFVAGLDCSIVSRYPLQPLQERRPVHCTRALLSLPQNRQLLVTSLRLTPPLGRIDLWRPSAWRAYREDRQFRRSQLQYVLGATSAQPGLPEILGGDFNAPAGDGIYKLLTSYRDAHRASGRGWGNTALNTLPFFRPDQIWLNRLSPTASRAAQTRHSDHRMVVADVILP